MKGNTITKQKLIQLIQALSRMRKQPINLKHYEKIAEQLSYPSLDKIEKLFGSWDVLLEEAGFDNPSQSSSLKNRSYTSKIKSSWSTAQSFSFYKDQKGMYVSIKEYAELRSRHPEMISSSTICNHFGTWKEAVTHHGLSSTRQFTLEECFQALQQASEECVPKFNSTQYLKWSDGKNVPSLGTIVKRFSTWSSAKNALREWRNQN